MVMVLGHPNSDKKNLMKQIYEMDFGDVEQTDRFIDTRFSFGAEKVCFVDDVNQDHEPKSWAATFDKNTIGLLMVVPLNEYDTDQFQESIKLFEKLIGIESINNIAGAVAFTLL
eukprot:TRINITY_DN4665_c0_g1_i1.p1 TRINITY_DN4665_c0_g1~~TRINITY_DN4665_c0_g1_i1.p1  ORF type:complete len:114 (-),score=13.13 TRINITY_DN4665_c0_g1_i1:158-499(-)